MIQSERGTRLVGILFGLVAVAVACAPALGAELEDVLARFDEAQERVRTLSASFTETTTNPMLLAPIVAEGRFFMTKPDSIRWEYSVPETMSFVIANDEYTGYFPAQKRAERRNIRRWSEQLFRFIGLGQGSEELARFYDIRLEQAADAAGSHLLVLDPKKRRVRKRVEEVRFVLDASTYLPREVEYRGKDGSSRVIRFEDVRLNPDLAAGLYRVDLPADVTVTAGFSGLPSSTPASAR